MQLLFGTTLNFSSNRQQTSWLGSPWKPGFPWAGAALPGVGVVAPWASALLFGTMAKSAPRTIRVARATKRQQEQARLANGKHLRTLPLTRGDCDTAPRPCPHVGCKHHLYLEASPTTGTIKLNHPALQPHELQVSCALDVADRGGVRLEDVAQLMGVTRERIRQIEHQALQKLEASGLQFWMDV